MILNHKLIKEILSEAIFFCIHICPSCKIRTKHGNNIGPEMTKSACFLLGLLPGGELAAWWEHGLLLLKPPYLGVLPQRQRRKSRGGISLGSHLVSHADKKHIGQVAHKEQASPISWISGSSRITPSHPQIRVCSARVVSGRWCIPSASHSCDSAEA